MVELIDLTMPIEDAMNSHPLQQPPSPVVWKSSRHGMTYQVFDSFEDEILNPEGRPFSIENETVVMSAHTGTHMDAPVHADPDSDVGIDAVDLNRLHTDCVLLDVRDSVGVEEPIEAEDLNDAADAVGINPATDIDAGDSVFIYTGWSEEYLDSEMYHRHPGLTDSSAKWCLEQDVGLVGIDCPNIDLSTSSRQPSHVGFLRRGWPESVLVIENLCNLGALPSPRFQVWTLPIPFADASGSPVRVVAMAD